jgi:hypothetical protein
MNQDGKRSDDFEDRLFSELRATVSDRGSREPDGAEATNTRSAWRRGPRLALAGGAVAAIAVAALILTAGGSDTSKAYAVTPQGDGKVAIEIRSLSDPHGLERALDAAGVPTQVTYQPAAASCDPADSVPSDEGEAVVPLSSGVPTVKAEAAHLTIDAKKVGPGQTVVLTADREAGGIKASAMVMNEVGTSVEGSTPVPAEGKVGTCEGSTGTTSATRAEKSQEAGQASVPSVRGVPTTPSVSSEG